MMASPGVLVQLSKAVPMPSSVFGPPTNQHAAICLAGDRAINEDAVYSCPERGVFLVADGCGGTGKGDFAASVLLRCVAQTDHAPTALEMANTQLVRALEANPELQGMGATFAWLRLQGLHADLFHMGDVRAYLIRNGRLLQLTEDHTLASQLLKLKQLSPQEALTHPARKTILRFLGKSSTPNWQQQSIVLAPHDVLLLCSDGFYASLDPKTLASLADSTAPIAERLEAAAQEALANGSRDNLSAIAVRIAGDAPPSAVETTRRLRLITEQLLFSRHPQNDLHALLSDLLEMARDASGARQGRLFQRRHDTWHLEFPTLAPAADAEACRQMSEAIAGMRPLGDGSSHAAIPLGTAGEWVLYLDLHPTSRLEQLAPYQELLAWVPTFCEIGRLRSAE